MKKIIILNIAALFITSAAFAEASKVVTFADAGKKVMASGGPVTSTSPAAIGTLSTKVGLGWNTGALSYAINTQHLQGTKAFGSAADSTKVYILDVTKGTAVAVPGASDSSAFDTDWKTM
jgi:hypothetical protein